MKNNKDDIVFSLTVADFESILGRELKDDEIDIIVNKFSIDSWSEDAECFLDVRGIKWKNQSSSQKLPKMKLKRW